MDGVGNPDRKRQRVIGNFFDLLQREDHCRGRRGLSGSGAGVQECGDLQGWRENLGTCDATARRVSIGGRERRGRVCDGRAPRWGAGVGRYEGGYVTVGPTGAETSVDGLRWNSIGKVNFNAYAFPFLGNAGWAVGPHGIVAKFLDQ